MLARTTSIGQPGISALLKKISTLPGQNKRVRDLRTQCRNCGPALKHNAARSRVLNLHSQFSNIHIQSTTSTPQRDVPTPSSIILFPAIHELRRLCTSSRYSSSLIGTLALPQPVSAPKNVVAVHPLSSTSTVDNAYEKCLELGIDPHGPHPDDFIPDEHGQHFEAGSKYAY